MKQVKFTICSIPDTIWFDCPYCGEEVGYKYGEVDPVYNKEVSCKCCGEYVRLGEHEYEYDS